MTKALDAASIAHAVTGSAAASLFGVGPNQVVLTTVRVTPRVSLEAAAHALGAEITERGPNVCLIRDTGEVGCLNADLRSEIRVAPAVRVYLDLFSERRGEDLGVEFRERVLGY